MAVPEEVMGETVTVTGGGLAAVVLAMARVRARVVIANSVVNEGRLWVVIGGPVAKGGIMSTGMVHKYYELVKKTSMHAVR